VRGFAGVPGYPGQDAELAYQDTLDRRRRLLGEDHPDTLESADDLAADLRALAEADDNP
jgi:hypothetical protein